INPRALEPLLKAQADELGNTPEGKSLAVFLTYWRALDGVSLSLLVDSNPELVVSLHARSDQLPAPARKLVAEMAKPSDVWTRLPADSIIAFGARTDFEALAETLEQLLPGDTEDGLTDVVRQSLGLPIDRELLKALPPHLGPDWGLWW